MKRSIYLVKYKQWYSDAHWPSVETQVTVIAESPRNAVKVLNCKLQNENASNSGFDLHIQDITFNGEVYAEQKY